MPRRVREIIGGKEKKTRKPFFVLMPKEQREKVRGWLAGGATREHFEALRKAHMDKAEEILRGYKLDALVANQQQLQKVVDRKDLGAFNRLVTKQEEIVKDIVPKRTKAYLLTLHTAMRSDPSLRLWEGYMRELRSAHKISDPAEREEVQKQIKVRYKTIAEQLGFKQAAFKDLPTKKELLYREKVYGVMGQLEALRVKIELLGPMLNVRHIFLTLMKKEAGPAQLEKLSGMRARLEKDIAKFKKMQEQHGRTAKQLDGLNKTLQDKLWYLKIKEAEREGTRDIYR